MISDRDPQLNIRFRFLRRYTDKYMEAHIISAHVDWLVVERDYEDHRPRSFS